MKKLKLKYNSMSKKIMVNDKAVENINNNRAGKRIMLVSHDLSLTGAPVALHFVAKMILKNGDIPVYVCPVDGNLSKEILNDGIMVMIDPDLMIVEELEAGNQKACEKLIKRIASFDSIMVCTLVLYQLIDVLSRNNIRALWWIHESKESYKLGGDKLIPKELSDCIKVYCGGDYAQKWLLNSRPNYSTNILNYGVTDVSKSYPRNMTNEKLKFAIVGTVEYRKGQDILANAISLLNQREIRACHFDFIGRNIDEKIYSKVLEIKEKYPDNISLISEVTRTELMERYAEYDCVICASRDDPMPVFITEAMMMSIVCICSENTGTASYITDGVNGYVYRNNSSQELAEKIRNIMSRNSELEDIRIRSRETYLRHFSEDILLENLINAFNVK